MTFKSLSFSKPGTGSGGFYGDGRVCVWRNWRVAEHGLVKHAPDRITVIEEYPPQCMIGVDLYAERSELDDDTFPEFQTQWYGVGQLPLARLAELGWPLQRLQKSIIDGPGGQKAWEQRMRNPGGFQPSLDGNAPAAEGPFYGSDTDDGMYRGSGGWLLLEEIKNLAALAGDDIDDRLAAHGLRALEGLVAKAGTKEVPKSKSQQQKEQLTGESKDARKILVPVEVVTWPWQADGTQTGAAVNTAAPAAAKSAAKAAAPKGAPKQSAASTEPVAAAPQPGASAEPTDDDMVIAEGILKILEKTGAIVAGPSGLGMKMMQHFNGNKKLRDYMQRGNSAEFLSSEVFNGVFWEFDAATKKVSPIPQQ
jgi:hypothetical protein